MARSPAEILSPARTELARGRPRAALRELEAARTELLEAGDAEGLAEALELTRQVRTLAPADAKTRERLLAVIEEAIARAAPVRAAEATGAASVQYGSLTARLLSEGALAPARAEMERQNVDRALKKLEKARQKLLAASELNGLAELIELARRLPVTKPRHEQERWRLIDAAQQNMRFLSRRKALAAGETWVDPFQAAKPRTKLPTLPPMTRREKLIAAAIVVVLAGGITTWALATRAPQRVAHAIKCPTGQQGSPTWSPDGKQIAFAKNGSCGTQIMVVPASGGPLRTVTNGYGVLPDWSPDGHTILYHSGDGFSVVPVQGGKSHLLRSDDGHYGAVWSPDGKEIAYTHGLLPLAGEHYASTMYVMQSDGSGSRPIVGHECNPGTPSWSPRGRRLVFACSGGIYVSDLSGRRFEFIDEPFDADTFALPKVSWSPDGRSIAFGWNGIELASEESGVAPNGIRVQKMIAGVANSESATISVDWSPDGRRIAYSVTGSGSGDGLYVIDRDGKHRHRLVAF